MRCAAGLASRGAFLRACVWRVSFLRRNRMRSIGVLFLVAMMCANTFAEAGTMLVYVGSTGGEKSKGISVMRMDAATGKLSGPEVAAEAKRASFVAIHPS